MAEKIDVIRDKKHISKVMTDEKLCNAITFTTLSEICYICGVKPKQYNQIKQASKQDVDITVFQFGFSTLHAWIRFFDFQPHMLCRLELKTCQSRDI